MTEDIEKGTTIDESDIEPILKSSSKEGQIKELSSSEKWAVNRGILAWTSSFLLHSMIFILLIKKFHMDFIETLFVRSLIHLCWLFSWKYGVTICICSWVFWRYRWVFAGLNTMSSYLGVLYIPLGFALTILIYTAQIFTMIFSYILLRTRQGLRNISLAFLLVWFWLVGLLSYSLKILHSFNYLQQIKKTNQTYISAEKRSSIDIETIHWMGFRAVGRSENLGVPLVIRRT